VDAYFSSCSVYHDIHKTIERHRDAVRCYSKWCQRSFKIAKAAVMGERIAVDQAECVAGTWRQTKVVPSDSDPPLLSA
jgi:hypothetical protein